MLDLLKLLLFPLLAAAAPSPQTWQFIRNGTTGIIALEAIVVSPSLAVLFDLAQNDPLQVNGHSAWGALWNFETNAATPLDVVSDTFCASGGFLSNGTMVSRIQQPYDLCAASPVRAAGPYQWSGLTLLPVG